MEQVRCSFQPGGALGSSGATAEHTSSNSNNNSNSSSVADGAGSCVNGGTGATGSGQQAGVSRALQTPSPGLAALGVGCQLLRMGVFHYASRHLVVLHQALQRHNPELRPAAAAAAGAAAATAGAEAAAAAEVGQQQQALRKSAYRQGAKRR